MKKIIGILYICTGPYVLFWEDFYKTFEKNFLPNFEKRYFVFTDASKIYSEDKTNVFKYNLNAQPWPLITLLRFSTFLTIEDEISKCDYLMFSNANMICDQIINEAEFLPQEKNGEELFMTNHPGYYKKSKLKFPYDRNPRSLAYIPWNQGNNYVIGAMFGGTSKSFLNMSKILKERIEEDLKNNIIAKWHDESHLNRYLIHKKNVRLLSPEYCYPYGMNVSYSKKISAVSKQDKFDVKKFKGQEKKEIKKIKKVLIKIKNTILIKERFLFMIDLVLNKKIKEINNEH